MTNTHVPTNFTNVESFNNDLNNHSFLYYYLTTISLTLKSWTLTKLTLIKSAFSLVDVECRPARYSFSSWFFIILENLITPENLVDDKAASPEVLKLYFLSFRKYHSEIQLV